MINRPNIVAARILLALEVRPAAKTMAEMPAIVTARTTDGSTRVMIANHAKINNVKTKRGDRLRRERTGATTAKINATFCPETAVRWARPLERNRRTMESGC